MLITIDRWTFPSFLNNLVCRQAVKLTKCSSSYTNGDGFRGQKALILELLLGSPSSQNWMYVECLSRFHYSSWPSIRPSGLFSDSCSLSRCWFSVLMECDLTTISTRACYGQVRFSTCWLPRVWPLILRSEDFLTMIAGLGCVISSGITLVVMALECRSIFLSDVWIPDFLPKVNWRRDCVPWCCEGTQKNAIRCIHYEHGGQRIYSHADIELPKSAIHWRRISPHVISRQANVQLRWSSGWSQRYLPRWHAQKCLGRWRRTGRPCRPATH